MYNAHPPFSQSYFGEKVQIIHKVLRVVFRCASHRKLNKAGVKRKLLNTVKARKLAYYGHTKRKQGSCLEKEIMQGTMPGARWRGRPRTAWMDNIKTWTGLPVEESIRMIEDRNKRRMYVQPSDRGRLKNRTVVEGEVSTCPESMTRTRSH